jgi:hypothetical protein
MTLDSISAAVSLQPSSLLAGVGRLEANAGLAIGLFDCSFNCS